MATNKNFMGSLILAVSVVILLQSCTQDKTDLRQIAYNKENARKHFISLANAAALTAGYRKEKTTLRRQLTDSNYLANNFDLPDAETFNRDAIAALLNQKDAKGIRIYLGRDSKGLIRMVIAAVDGNDDDIAGNTRVTPPKTGFITASYADNLTIGVLLESGQRCPTLCGGRSPLK